MARMNSPAASAGPFAARVLPDRLFYGWYVAIACGILMFVGVGVGYYGLPIFLKPLKDEHQWSTTAVSWAPTIYFCVAGTHFLNSRHNPRSSMRFGCQALISDVCVHVLRQKGFRHGDLLVHVR